MEESGERSLRKKNFIKQFLLESFAILYWLYTFTKIFIYDIDIYLIQRFFPGISWIIEFKFPIFLGVLAVLWLFTRNKEILSGLIYILFYPFIVFLWKIPKLLFIKRSWIGAFAFIGLILSFIKSLKTNTIALALLLIPVCISWRFNHPLLLWGVIALLIIFIIILYFRVFYFAFKPSMLFQIQSIVISWSWDKFKPGLIPDDEIKSLTVDKMDDKQLQKWSSCLQSAVIYNKVCYFLTSKLKDFQRSKINILYYLFNYFVVFLLTIFVFGVMNYSLYKINHNNFLVSFTPRFFHFLYYSANTLFKINIPDFTALSFVARIFGTVEVFFAFLLVGILSYLLLTVQSKRNNEEIESVVQAIKKQGENLDEFINVQYKMTVEEAIKELDEIKAGLIKVIYYLSSNINR